MLGCELWIENFDSLFALVKKCINNLWEVRKHKEPCFTQPQSQSLGGDLRDRTVDRGQRRGKFGSSVTQGE